MSNHHYTEKIEYDESIAPNSPYPEWIETDSLRMERLTPSNLSPETLHRAFKENAGVDRYFTTEEGLGSSMSDALEQYERAEEVWASRTGAFYAIFAMDSGEFVGFATLEDTEFDLQRASIGIWLTRDAWGYGYSQERAEALLEVLFIHLDFKLVEISVVPENENSVRAVTKYVSTFGGSFDGRLRRATFTPTGDVYDVYKWSISAAEYESEDGEYSDKLSTPDHPNRTDSQ